MSERDIRIGSIVIDCDDFPRMKAFWEAALGYVPREPSEDGWVVLRDPHGEGPNLSLNRTSEGHLEPYRLHLDLYTSRRNVEVQRLLTLGATLHPNSGQNGGDFVVLADPDGNLFCVVQKGSG